MAFATVGRDVHRPWSSKIAFAWVLRCFTGVSIRIATVTIVTCETATSMDVVLKELGRSTQPRII